VAIRIETDIIGLTALILVTASWVVFALIFMLQKKRPKAEEKKRAPAATWGIFLQGLSFGMVWALRRARWWPFPPMPLGELALALVAVLLAWGSNWWCLLAVRTLGKQWTYRARVIEGHELITDGPYGVVRNPIYLGMFALMVATGLVVANWWALLLAIVIFLIGNEIRIRQEEKLLREAFGAKFDEYRQRVPAFVPRIG
jgi:protein-S-isoprenylcysteine O-methyltransferase Ste14